MRRDYVFFVILALIFAVIVIITANIAKNIVGSTSSLPPSPSNTVVEQIKNRISLGERTLAECEFSNMSDSEKSEAVTHKRKANNLIKAGEKQDFENAEKLLDEVRSINRNTPESLIYLNNAKNYTNGSNQAQYTIAVAVPLSSNCFGSLEVLRGVAQAQAMINERNGGLDGKGGRLRVIIADDGYTTNDSDRNLEETGTEKAKEIAKQIATLLVSKKEVLGVVGHWTSPITIAAGAVYQENKLVAVSPISTAVALTSAFPKDSSRYIFRTVPSDFVIARALAEYARSLRNSKAVTFYDFGSEYGMSLASEFATAFVQREGDDLLREVIREIDLASKEKFEARVMAKQLINEGIGIAMLVVTNQEGEVLNRAFKIISQFNEMDTKRNVAILGGDGFFGQANLDNQGANLDGMVISIPWHIKNCKDRTTLEKDFLDNAEKLWGICNVNWRTLLSYDAAIALIEGVKSAPTRSGVQARLISGDSIEGASGNINFSKTGDRVIGAQLVQVQKAKFGKVYEFVSVKSID